MKPIGGSQLELVSPSTAHMTKISRSRILYDGVGAQGDAATQNIDIEAINGKIIQVS